MKNKVHIINKKAKFEYILNDSFISGIVLTGSEIKSIRNNKVSIREGFCKFLEDELFIINMNIEKYEFSNDEVYNPKRQRKLLLNKKELGKLKKSRLFCPLFSKSIEDVVISPFYIENNQGGAI